MAPICPLTACTTCLQYDFWLEPRAVGDRAEIMTSPQALSRLTAILYKHDINFDIMVPNVGE